MSFSEIEINYDTYYDIWLRSIETALKERDIQQWNENLPVIICKSLRKTVEKYLINLNYKPRNQLEYRKKLVKRLDECGLQLIIRSNKILWLYLDYFTDLTDYSKCFDIKICVKDIDKALSKVTYKSINIADNVIEGLFELPRSTQNQVIIDRKIEMLKQKATSEQNRNLKLIADILDMLNEREDL